MQGSITRTKQYITSICLAVLTVLISTISFAQDGGGSGTGGGTVDVNINSNDGGGFFASPWVWVVGIAIFILLLVALLRGGSRREA